MVSFILFHYEVSFDPLLGEGNHVTAVICGGINFDPVQNMEEG